MAQSKPESTPGKAIRYDADSYEPFKREFLNSGRPEHITQYIKQFQLIEIRQKSRIYLSNVTCTSNIGL